MRETYIHQVELLLDVLPIVMKDSRLALKVCQPPKYGQN